jgi:hypothetical protein
MSKREVCEHCQEPGHSFYSGVPGVLARVKDGKLIKGTHHYVAACEECQRFPDQQWALKTLLSAGVADAEDFFLMSEPAGWDKILDVSWIQTCGGTRFHLQNPTPEMVDIDDIAIALSRIPRFNGHTKKHKCALSVAQHSLMVAQMLPDELKLVGLLHDSPEYVLGDMTRPLKRMFPEFKILESRVLFAITEAFHLDMADFFLPEIHAADNQALAIDIQDCLYIPKVTPDWPMLPTTMAGVPTVTWPAEKAAKEFLKAYRQLRARL